MAYRLGKIRARGILHGSWLDCGCAVGGYTLALAKWGAERVVGIDVEPERLREAQARETDSANVTFRYVASDDLPFPDASFDAVLLNEVLEHVADEGHTLREIRRVLREGGHLVLMGPNRWFPFEGHGMRIGDRKINVPVPILPWIPAVIAQPFMRARNYWPHEMQHLVRGAGFEILETSVVFPVFERWPWLPAPVIIWYRRLVPVLERAPIVRRFGVSTFILARK